MSKVTQCDRCGAIIKNSMRSDPEEQWWRYSIKKDLWPYSQHEDLLLDIDLCDDCLHSLYNWLMEGDKRN